MSSLSFALLILHGVDGQSAAAAAAAAAGRHRRHVVPVAC